MLTLRLYDGAAFTILTSGCDVAMLQYWRPSLGNECLWNDELPWLGALKPIDFLGLGPSGCHATL
jgi:hypothetical protein